MENSYGIDVTNKFALFFDNDDDESDPLDILKLQETLRETKEKTSKKTPTDSKATKNNQNKEQSTKKDQQSNATTQKRDGNFYSITVVIQVTFPISCKGT